MTAFTLQVTSKEGKNPDDSDEMMMESIEYWDQPRATQKLQVAMDKMSWPASVDAEIMSPPSKKVKY
jgi:hypothetical protein